ncbi:hypothetical protein M441DRAFT_341359 [Trichoderma asperellum CBS 433.97]|uniref:Uncharacterized protein n=1 Tax=Trichoderma asperellum (strain ATCC 204424 / CBS 433.97 / NBRC 101777) TaxID=1042311 RepID=A0A2T3ZH07_TRIA4|nr:hypothetical protein M441DRAFT_341359 [Trichoderma asperellum CBS 433.97]PTB44094.1 hypothetical protein M441DRAFT_341359 [Trichoderma asperellum CBS 433.97]
MGRFRRESHANRPPPLPWPPLVPSCPLLRLCHHHPSRPWLSCLHFRCPLRRFPLPLPPSFLSLHRAWKQNPHLVLSVDACPCCQSALRPRPRPVTGSTSTPPSTWPAVSVRASQCRQGHLQSYLRTYVKVNKTKSPSAGGGLSPFSFR